jgi:hypothetical protein
MHQVPVGDNYYAALNSAVFSDGSFVYIPKGVKSAMELSTYFRINAKETGQVWEMPLCLCLPLHFISLHFMWPHLMAQEDDFISRGKADDLHLWAQQDDLIPQGSGICPRVA